MIVIGYQGIGKSTICKDNPRYIDFESSALKMFGRRPPGWEMPYCQMAIWLSKQGYVVFTSSHKEVRKLLTESNEYCIAIAPSAELEKEWIAKLSTRYEESRLEKDRLAYLNAQDRYVENIAEIVKDVENVVVINRMDYDLNLIVTNCEKSCVQRKVVQSMNRQEAADFLDKCRWWFEPYTCEKDKWNEALDMAIEALQDDWIPVSELPKDARPVLVYAWNVHHVVGQYKSMMTDNGEWEDMWVTSSAYDAPHKIEKVIAWKPLTIPCKESGNE